jgi:hypothetical protein
MGFIAMSRSFWNYTGFNNLGFFSNLEVYDWLVSGGFEDTTI